MRKLNNLYRNWSHWLLRLPLRCKKPKPKNLLIKMNKKPRHLSRNVRLKMRPLLKRSVEICITYRPNASQFVLQVKPRQRLRPSLNN